MVVAGGYYCYIGSAESEYPLEGYLAHERLPPPPRTATGAQAWPYCSVLLVFL